METGATAVTEVEAAPAAGFVRMKEYRGTHCGKKKGKDFQKPSPLNDKAEAKLAQRKAQHMHAIAYHDKLGHNCAAACMKENVPGSMNVRRH